MKLTVHSAIAVSIIDGAKPQIKTAEGVNFGFFYFSIVRLGANFVLHAFTLQPDHQAYIHFVLDPMNVEVDASDELLGQIFRADFTRLRKILRAAGTNDVSIEIHPFTPDRAIFRVIPKRKEDDATKPETTDPTKKKSPAKAQTTSELTLTLPLALEPGSIVIPDVGVSNILAPCTLARSLRTAHNAIRTAGRDYRSSNAAHLHINPDGVQVEALTANLLVSSEWGKEAFIDTPAADGVSAPLPIGEGLGVGLAPNSVRRIYEVGLREGTETPIRYNADTETLTISIGVYTYVVKAETVGEEVCKPIFNQTTSADSTVFLDRKQLLAIFQKFRSLGCGTVGIDFAPGGQVELTDINGTFSARINGLQHLFAEPRVNRSFEVSVGSVLAFLPLMTSDDIAFTFGLEDAPIKVFGTAPDDTIHAVVKTL